MKARQQQIPGAAAANSGALQGIRVLDFGQYLSAPMVAMFLADNGADVIHVDPPEGPRWNHPANAALYRGKRSIRLDLKTPAGLAEAQRLAAGADVVIENFRPGVMDRLGLDAVKAQAGNPGLVWCSMPGFAADDPRAALPAWEGIVCAAAGLYPAARYADGEAPVFTAMPLASNFGAFVAAHRIAGALLERLKSGRGQRLEVSLFEACFQGLGLYAESPPSRDMSIATTTLVRMRRLMRMRPTADETYIYFDSPLRGLQAFVARFLPGRDLLALDDAGLDQLAKDLDALFLQKPGAEWERICQEELKGAFGLVQRLPAWLADPHALQSETLVRVEDAELGSTVQAGYAALLSRSKPAVRWGRGQADPAPGSAIDWMEPRRADISQESGAAGLPLGGLRVLDCSTLLAGPTTARVLAQYGAEVIKLDRAGIASGDVDPLSDDSVAFIGARTVSGGKRMMFVDLKQPEGQEILRALLRKADIVHHNFTPDAARRLGLSPGQVGQQNGAAILSTMSLHSRGGFRAEYRGHDMLAQMITGMGHRAGGSGTPQVVSTYLNDNAAGHLHAFGIMLALLHRHRTGEGQEVNASLSRTATLHQVPSMVGFEGRVWDEPAGPLARGWHAFDRLYQARDGWLYLCAGPADAAARLARVAAFEGLAGVAESDVEGWLERRFAELAVDRSVALLREAGLSAHRYMSLHALALDDYVDRHGLITVLDHPGIGRAMGVGLRVYDRDGRSGPAFLHARRPGMDSLDILKEYGFEPALPELLRRGVVALGEMPILNTPRTSGYWSDPRRRKPPDTGGLPPSDALIEKITQGRPGSSRA